MGVIEIGLYIAPCVVEIFLQWLEYHRSHARSSIFALLAFICFTIGLLALAGVTSYKAHPYQPWLWLIARFSLGSGSVFWITSQILWFRRKVVIIPQKLNAQNGQG